VGENVKTFVVVFLATLSAAVGETLISYAMKKNGQVDLTELSQWIKLIFSVVRNPYIFMGVIFLGIFFFLYLAALSWADISFVLPLTALSYIFVALLAKFFLREDVSWYRWAGTLVIIIGIILVALDQRQQTVDYPGNAQVSGNSQEVPDTNKGSF
jgi:drug/metabolite transporter (DMT)-like permease